ncbi:hypothetical protein RJT34_31411 [Clitoria ternatea]|uniref:Cryptochrome/DNA photolyase FAD-binding domain-containing protein n=1 Tax=Clitoria ternatea TaxID=43366 RepID=A0AAN9I3J5_CLITE
MLQIQGAKFDPEGEYVRQWLPELARMPTEWIHHPWDAPLCVLRAAGVDSKNDMPIQKRPKCVAKEGQNQDNNSQNHKKDTGVSSIDQDICSTADSSSCKKVHQYQHLFIFCSTTVLLIF